MNLNRTAVCVASFLAGVNLTVAFAYYITGGSPWAVFVLMLSASISVALTLASPEAN